MTIKLSILNKLVLLLIVLTPSFALVGHQPAFASVKDQVQGGVNDASGGSSTANPGKTLNETIAEVVNLLSAAVGVVAVIMIIVGGFRYITSAGESTKVTAAKNTLLYAVIGLVIVALAQVIVHFVINKVK